jgi:flagellar basal body-associated protein FliL
MELTIIVSVLATLGVVAMVMAIAVMFNRLKGKVDVNDFRELTNTIFNEIETNLREQNDNNVKLNRDFNDTLREVHQILDKADEEIKNDVYRELTDIRRFIDSRCDKLDNKIQALTPAGEGDKPLIKG